MAVYHSNEDAWRGNVLDAVTTATAAERARALGWLQPGINAVSGLSWSDPAGLTSDHAFDPVAATFQVTAEPNVSTPEPDTWAGWEGELYGEGDNVSWATNAQGIITRICRDSTFSNGRMRVGCDFRAGLFILNGPRATATVGMGAGFRAPGASVSALRVETWILRGGIWASGFGSANSLLSCVQGNSGAGTSYAAGARWVAADGSMTTTSTSGATVLSGNPLAIGDWGSETWVAVLFGRTNGSGVAPNDTAETFSFQPHFIYSAPDWTLSGVV